MNRMISVNPGRCLACRSCELACAVAHSRSKNLVTAMMEEPRPQSRVQVEGTAALCIPLQCRHCEDAPCVKICPTGAMEKMGPGGPVIVHKDKCIGCTWCVMVCPFGAVTMERGGTAVVKCDLCIERLAEGLEPACVASCPTGALKFLSPEEVAKMRRDAVAGDYIVNFTK